MFLTASIVMALALGSCQQPTQNASLAAQEQEQAPAPNITECDVKIGNVAFTHALNGGDTCISIMQGENNLEFRCTEKRDIFCDPNGKLSNNTIPALLAAIDNTKPFTFTAKVTPGFTPEGRYNAADLMVYACDTLWQKLCYEQDERGRHRIVSVRTAGTSDDNNHQELDVPTVYLRLSSDTHTLASYYSTDKKVWQMVRLYENYYPERIWVGIASQSPTTGVCTSIFEEVTIEQTSVGDFRTGD